METIYLSIQSSLTVTIIVGLFFIGLGYLNSKKTSDNRNYIIGNRDENTFSLTTSLAASALGAWILFGPASAATWGGFGAVIGYALGAATPMLVLYNFGRSAICCTLGGKVRSTNRDGWLIDACRISSKLIKNDIWTASRRIGTQRRTVNRPLGNIQARRRPWNVCNIIRFPNTGI